MGGFAAAPYDVLLDIPSQVWPRKNLHEVKICLFQYIILIPFPKLPVTLETLSDIPNTVFLTKLAAP